MSKAPYGLVNQAVTRMAHPLVQSSLQCTQTMHIFEHVSVASTTLICYEQLLSNPVTVSPLEAGTELIVIFSNLA